MDTETLVKDLLDDGQKLVEELPHLSFEVTAAFWLKPSEDGRWYFYLVAPVVDKEGLTEGYRRLHRLVRTIPALVTLDPLGIKLIGPNSLLAQDVQAILSRFRDPLNRPLRWSGKMLGNMSIEEMYLYPQPTATP